MSNLQLSLKKQWFEMTKAGIKTEDYREITPYWAYRLFNKSNKFGISTIESKWFWAGYLGRIENNERVYKFRNEKTINYAIETYGFQPFTQNIMTLGYPKSTDTERILILEHKGIEIRTGNTEWGAEPGKIYFVIKHGNILHPLQTYNHD